MKYLLTALALTCALGASAASPMATTHAEIDALLQALAHSDCEFYRNGSWYPGTKAASHLQRKLDYYERKGEIADAAAFIAAAATRSSMSGEVYQVRCPGQPTEPSATWLTRRLEQLRAGKTEPRH